MFEVLSGERLVHPARAITMDGREVADEGIVLRRDLGAAFVPEERLGHGAVPDFSLTDNVILTRHGTGDGVAPSGVLNAKVAGEIQARVTDDFDVRKSAPNPEARALSGGNLQKYVVGRELDRSPKLLIINQPTWGVDAGAAALIRQAIIDLAVQGAAVLVVSQDLDEIYELADRIAVISRGQLSIARPAGELSLQDIGMMMAGSHEAGVA